MGWEGAKAYEEQGVVVLRNFFPATALQHMRAAFERLASQAFQLSENATLAGSLFVVAKKDDKTQVNRVVWCGGWEPELLTLGRDPRILEIASLLLRTRSLMHIINQAHFKFPGDGVSFPLHQDCSHRRYGTNLWRDVNGDGSFAQFIAAVDDASINNGPLLVIPKSHKRGHLKTPEGVYDLCDAGLCSRDEAVPLLMQAGDLAILNPFTIHGSYPNRSTAPRRVLINGFCPPGANYREYPGCGLGELVES